MTLYEQFKQFKMDFSCIGLEKRDSCGGYFCTPKDAEIIGWAGVDGIHYCLIKGFGEMVFAVSPMNMPGDYTHWQRILRIFCVCCWPAKTLRRLNRRMHGNKRSLTNL